MARGTGVVADCVERVVFSFQFSPHDTRTLATDQSNLRRSFGLPFTDALKDPQMEYLPDGITESLIGSLSQLPALTVMARSTVFNYKGREVDPRQVGADLKVRAVVIGRVARQGEQLLINAELVDTSNGARLWGGRISACAQRRVARQG